MAPSPTPPFILPCLQPPVRTSLLGLICRPLLVFIHVLEKALEEVLEMLDRVSEYVARVIVCFPPLGQKWEEMLTSALGAGNTRALLLGSSWWTRLVWHLKSHPPTSRECSTLISRTSYSGDTWRTLSERRSIYRYPTGWGAPISEPLPPLQSRLLQTLLPRAPLLQLEENSK